MEEVTLYEYETSAIYILMKVYFNNQGQLIFEGLDCGETVKMVWGDFDYEYQYMIEPEEVKRLYPLFRVDQQDKDGLLLAIQKQYSDNEAYTKFGKFLKENLIKFSAFSWV